MFNGFCRGSGQKVPDGPQEKLNVEWLFQKRGDSEVGGALMLMRQGCDDDDWYLGMRAVHQLESVPAIAVGHIEIEQNQVRLVGDEFLGGFAACCGQGDAVLLQYQYLSERMADSCVIVCQQD